jgi:hypothetical protein
MLGASERERSVCGWGAKSAGFIPDGSNGAVKAASGRLQGSLLLKAVFFKDEDCGAAECGEPAPKNSTFMSGSGLGIH